MVRPARNLQKERGKILPRKTLPSQWNDWKWQIRNRITSVEDLEEWISLTPEERKAINFSRGLFHFSLTPYWASLLDPENLFCPLRRQTIPDGEEFMALSSRGTQDSVYPKFIPNQRLAHISTGKAVFFLHSGCALYCRYCPNKKISEHKNPFQESFLPRFAAVNRKEWFEVSAYLRSHPEIKELTITGGEPLLLNDDILLGILHDLKAISSIEVLKLETRIVSVLPQRITPSLVRILKSFQPLYVVLGVNHPLEITEEFSLSCTKLANSGVPLLSETILLREINDRSEVLSELFLSLLGLRVRPYSLVHSFPHPGTEHFFADLREAQSLMHSLRGTIPELALPEFMVDTPEGRIALRQESLLSFTRKKALIRNHEGKVFLYP